MKRRLLAIVLAGVLVFSQNGAVLAAENSAADGTAAEVTVEEPDQTQEETEEQDAEQRGDITLVGSFNPETGQLEQVPWKELRIKHSE